MNVAIHVAHPLVARKVISSNLITNDVKIFASALVRQKVVIGFLWLFWVV